MNTSSLTNSLVGNLGLRLTVVLVQLSTLLQQVSQDKTTTTPRKASHSSRFRQLQKSAYRFGKKNSSQSETAHSSAVLAQSGTDTMVSMIPWPVPGHQRLDARQSPLGASQHAKKKPKKNLQERNNCGLHTGRRLHTAVLHAKIEIVC